MSSSWRGKLILDKRLGNVLLAGNLVGEHEWGFGATETEREVKLEADLAATYFVLPNVSVGAEVRHANVFSGGELEHSGLFIGPVVAYSQDNWWAALSVMPQVANFLQPTGSALDLEEYERFNARLLFSFHL